MLQQIHLWTPTCLFSSCTSTGKDEFVESLMHDPPKKKILLQAWCINFKEKLVKLDNIVVPNRWGELSLTWSLRQRSQNSVETEPRRPRLIGQWYYQRGYNAEWS